MSANILSKGSLFPNELIPTLIQRTATASTVIGNNPGTINGMRVETVSNLSANSSLDRALVGDFACCFRWGCAKEIPLELIIANQCFNAQANLALVCLSQRAWHRAMHYLFALR